MNQRLVERVKKNKPEADKIVKRYMKRLEIEVAISVLKQEKGLSRRIVCSKEGLMRWVGMSMRGYLMFGRKDLEVLL